MSLAVNVKGTMFPYRFQCPELLDLLSPCADGSCPLGEMLYRGRIGRLEEATRDTLLQPLSEADATPKLREFDAGWSQVISGEFSPATMIDIDRSTGFAVTCFEIARRTISKSLLQQMLDEEIARRRQQGERINRETKNRLKGELEQRLMGATPPRRTRCAVVFDLRQPYLMIYASAKNLEIITAQLEGELGIDIGYLGDSEANAALFARWLIDLPLPEGLMLGNRVEFMERPSAKGKAPDATICYKKHALDEVEEIPVYAQEKVVKTLSMQLGNRFHFTITPWLSFSGIKLDKPKAQPEAPLRLLSEPMTQAELMEQEQREQEQREQAAEEAEAHSDAGYQVLSRLRQVLDLVQLAAAQLAAESSADIKRA